IDDDSVSAAHARLEWDLGAWRITDLESTNGTSVEGVRLAPHVPTPLQYGATVRLGGVRLQLREAAGADPASARAGFVPPPPVPTLKEERRFRLPVWLLLVILVLAAVATWAVLELTRPPAGTPVAPAPTAGAPAPGTAAP
ncbi:MAG TPA: FHA domain-containing protein, partial [Longimicrobiaceae bacterium]|nr:FHA domain-containing protein [Longimicrobiaceae bacterium]